MKVNKILHHYEPKLNMKWSFYKNILPKKVVTIFVKSVNEYKNN